VGMVDPSEIDRIGILAATEIAMQKAVAEIATHHPDLYLLVDGRDAFWFDHPHSSIVRGDESEPCIAAASILAKVTRDRHMCALDQEIPTYGFAEHKGYGTSDHFEAIRTIGVSLQHRKTFLRNL
jgi:ribonuclease HII